MKLLILETIGSIAAFLMVFFSSINNALFAVGFLILVDTFVAIWASWKNNGVSSITSRKLGRIITKIVLYPLAIIVAKVAEQYLVPEIPFIKVTTGIVATVEVKSIYEKISLLLGFDLWQKIKKVLWKDKIEDLIKDENNRQR